MTTVAGDKVVHGEDQDTTQKVKELAPNGHIRASLLEDWQPRGEFLCRPLHHCEAIALNELFAVTGRIFQCQKHRIQVAMAFYS